MNNVYHSSESVEWYSPTSMIAVARATMGGIDLDPASCIEAQANVQAGHFYTQADDGLSQPWFGRVYCNPPYGQYIVPLWIERAVSAWEQGEISSAVLLVKSTTDVAWFHTVGALGWLCFVKGRLRFSDDSDAAPFPSLLIYLGNEPERFRAAAAPHGLISPPLLPARTVRQLRLAA